MIVVLVCVFIIITIIGLYLFTKNMYQQEMLVVDKKEYKLKDLMPAALFIQEQVIRCKYNSKVTNKIRENIILIYGKRDCNFKLRMHIADKISLTLFMLLIISSITLFIQIESSNTKIEENTITRLGFDEGNIKYTLQAKIDVDGTTSLLPIEINVPEEDPDRNMARKILQKAANNLTNIVIGDNQSTDSINQDLELVEFYPGTNIYIEWVINTPQYINNTGELKYFNLSDSGEDISINAILHYGEETDSKLMEFRAYPKNLTSNEKILLTKQFLEEELDFYTILQSNSKYIKLPTNVEKYDANIEWLVGKDYTAIQFMALGIVIVGFLIVMKDYELKKRVVERNNEIRLKFPELVNKMTLLINAGMTVYKAWSKIVAEYNMAILNGANKSFLYEEMTVTLNDINNGVSEIQAYEHFGRRCKISELMRFTWVLMQNSKKGNDSLVEALHEQSISAWEMRKKNAKLAGEKASSKLILPMGIILVIILIIVMIPAFMSIEV